MMQILTFGISGKMPGYLSSQTPIGTKRYDSDTGRHYLKWIILFLMAIFFQRSPAQEMQQAVEFTLEQEAKTQDGVVPEEDGLWQQWDYLGRHRLNLNMADEEALVHLLGLSKMEASLFIRYRSQFGKLIDVMELQAIPGLALETIRRILPFIKVAQETVDLPLLRERFKNGEHMVLCRGGITRDMYAAGFRKADDGFAGNDASVMLRYTYRYASLVQWGVTIEKDAGERFFPGGISRGPDFWTMHFSIRAVGSIRALVLGDFHVNLGQGLVHWQSMAFRKGASGISVHRQGLRVRPYNGTDENRFHRGIGVDIGKKNTGLLVFAAADRQDGNKVSDTTNGDDYAISSVQWSGLHRTLLELEDKDAFQQHVLGGSLYWNNGRWKLAWNGISYWFRNAIEKGGEPYGRFNISGRQWMNHSLDYGGTVRNMFLFGEIAQAGNRSFGFLQGLMISVDPRLDLAFVFRHFPASYKAMQANVFAEQSNPGNETGLYAAMSIRPFSAWRLDAWLDLYYNPWLQYGVNRPAQGRDWQLNLAWKPTKMLEITQRIHAGRNEISYPGDGPIYPATGLKSQIQYRIQVSFQPNRFIQLRQRAEISKVRLENQRDRGALFSVDMTAKLPKHPSSISARLSWFQADSYEARLFQFERDVLYSYAISSLFRRGLRTYLLFSSRFLQDWTIGLKASVTLFNDNQFISQIGQDRQPSGKWAVRLQFMRIF